MFSFSLLSRIDSQLCSEERKQGITCSSMHKWFSFAFSFLFSIHFFPWFHCPCKWAIFPYSPFLFSRCFLMRTHTHAATHTSASATTPKLTRTHTHVHASNVMPRCSCVLSECRPTRWRSIWFRIPHRHSCQQIRFRGRPMYMSILHPKTRNITKIKAMAKCSVLISMFRWIVLGGGMHFRALLLYADPFSSSLRFHRLRLIMWIIGSVLCSSEIGREAIHRAIVNRLRNVQLISSRIFFCKS